MKIMIEICGTLFAFLAFIMFISMACGEDTSGYTKIKFKTFKHFYEINPARWGLGSNHVWCYTDMFHAEHLRFGYIDKLRYMLWYVARDRYNTKKGQVESMSKVLAAVKEDIKNLELFANQQVQEGVDMINDILQEKRNE